MVLDVVFFGPNNPASIFVLVTGTSPTSVEPIQHAPGAYFFPHLSKINSFLGIMDELTL
jgi:hypothetical protein